MLRWRKWFFWVGVLALAGCGSDSEPTAGAVFLPLKAQRGAHAGVYDSEGRQVLLRGVNLNSLGDYYQDNPALPTVFPLDEDDFRQMAALGFNVVRLVLSWSALEPQRGQRSAAYLERIREAVALAKKHGLYVILDMHQDAWGKYIATPPGVDCGSTRERAIGWDGAPAWATITDGRSTCRAPGFRELSPAVAQAFENFYADRDGIQTAFIETWAYLVRAFAQEVAVAGYDLFNEPHWGNNIILGATPKLSAFYARLIPAIRAAERAAGGFEHIVFFEPIISWPVGNGTLPDPDVMTDPNLVFAPHNYAESNLEANPRSLEDVFAQAQADADLYGVTFWIGEYGWFSDPAGNKEKLERYAELEDRYRIGGAWWVWKQACGDPHSIRIPGSSPPSVVIRLHYTGCPANVNLGLVPEWVEVLSRPYPRAVPGRLVTLSSHVARGELVLEGETPRPGRAELWVPQRAGFPRVTGVGVRRASVETVPGGYRVLVEVEGRYQLRTYGALR